MSEWGAKAWEAMEELAKTGEPFTADDLEALVGHPDGGHTPNARNNTIGSLFRRASSSRLIAATGAIAKSRQPARKGGMVRVWRGR